MNATEKQLKDMRVAAVTGMDELQCAGDTLEQLSALFHAIQNQAEGEVKALAGLGWYMAEDWANMVNLSCEKLAKAVQL